MAILDQIAAARDDAFAARVAMITMTLCINVANEDPATANHANRIAFANKHFKAEINTKALAAAVIASNATIQTTIDASPALRGSNVPDGDINFAIAGLFNAFANAYAAP
jgi:hypothetical protein